MGRVGVVVAATILMTFLLLYGRVIRMLGPEARLAWILTGANLTLVAAVVAAPILLGRAIDILIVSQATGSIPSWPVLVALIFAFTGLCLLAVGGGAIVALYADRLAHRRRHGVLTTYFEHALQLPRNIEGGPHSGRLMKIMLSGTDAMWALWRDLFRDSFAATASIALLLPLALFLNWKLALILTGTGAAFALLAVLILRRTSTLQGSVEGHYSDLAERSSDVLSNIGLVQGFARVDAEVASLKDLVDRLLAAQIPVLSWWALAAVLTRAATTLAVLLIFLAGVWLRLHGQTSIGDIVMFMTFAGVLIGQLETIVRFINRLSDQAPQLQDFFGVLDTAPAVRDRPDGIDPGRLRGLVEFRAVCFAYHGKQPAVTDLSFTVLPGETTALVGATGAGKSTALALLHRAFDPQAGTIMVDGMDLRGLRLSALRHNIGTVLQETPLLNRSFAENLKLAKPDATESEMRESLARAQALDVVDASADGLGTQVGESGRLLSPAERQRLTIARALLKDAPILILEEAPGALEAAVDTKLQTALEEVTKNRTTFVIAHRLATIRNATRILVFDGGRIVESGSYDQLIQAGGRFTALAKAQFGISTARPRPLRTAVSAKAKRAT